MLPSDMNHAGRMFPVLDSPKNALIKNSAVMIVSISPHALRRLSANWGGCNHVAE